MHISTESIIHLGGQGNGEMILNVRGVSELTPLSIHITGCYKLLTCIDAYSRESPCAKKANLNYDNESSLFTC